jgi:hypothetical protein
VTPDEATIVMVGDGAQLLDHVKPYADHIEFYNTAGKKKNPPSPNAASPELAAALAGNWSLEIDTPLGQSIPAALILEHGENGLSGRVESEMGNGDVSSATFDGEAFSANVAFEVSGHAMEAQIVGEVAGEKMEGNITLGESTALSFTGNRTAS